MPTIISKPAIELFHEELRNYPEKKDLVLDHPQLNDFPLLHFRLLMESKKLHKQRIEQKGDASRIESIFNNVKQNFPFSKDQPVEPQAELFAHHITIQFLAKHYPSPFLKTCKDPKSFDVSVFKTNQIQGYINFYNYYVESQIPDSHDHADAWHASYLPYCSFAIMEQRLCSLINQIQKRQKCFKNVVVRNNKWLEKDLPNLYPDILQE